MKKLDRKSFALLCAAVILCLALCLAGCGETASPADTEQPEPAQETISLLDEDDPITGNWTCFCVQDKDFNTILDGDECRDCTLEIYEDGTMYTTKGSRKNLSIIAFDYEDDDNDLRKYITSNNITVLYSIKTDSVLTATDSYYFLFHRS